MKRQRPGNKLTSKEAAAVLGVSEASVKRWADGGLLPSEKTAGGHRRFRPEDLALFKREQRLGTASRGGVKASADQPGKKRAGVFDEAEEMSKF